MKKYLLLAAIVAAMGTGSILGYRSMSNVQNLSDTQLANIEALGDDPEIDYSMICDEEIEYTGGSSMPLYCKTCSFKWGYRSTGSTSRCTNKR